jgi:glycosyltransferase involved in cell wall biosynthesis
MKIVHLLGWYFPDSVGGTEVYVEALCRRLRRAGHDVLIAAPDVHRSRPERYEHDGVAVFRYPIPSAPTRDEALHRTAVRGAERLHRFLADERPDVLHLHSVTTGAGLPEIREAARLGIRVVVTGHLPGLGYMCRSGELMQWGRQPCDGYVTPAKCASCNLARLGMPRAAAGAVGAMPVAISRALQDLPGRLGTTLGMAASVDDYQAMQREMFELVDAFVVLNETARRMLLSNGAPPAKLLLNRLGIGCATMARKAPPAARPTSMPVAFGYLGRLHPTKGLVELMRAVRAVPADVRFTVDVRGPIVDEGSRRFAEELRAMAAGDPRVTIGPGVPYADVPARLAAIDALLCPSIWFENGPTVALEAMAVGTPVIGSRVGNLAEAIEDGVTGRLVTPGDVDAWTSALAAAAASPAHTIDRWRAALPSPRTMDEIATDYLALYAA